MALTILFLIFLFIVEFRSNSILIEEISVPSELADRGYNPQFVAHQILAEWKFIDQHAPTQKRRKEITLSSSAVDLNLPGSDISMRALTGYVKERLGFRIERLRGGIVRVDSDYSECFGQCYQLHFVLDGFRRTRDESDVFPADQLDALISQASRRALEKLDPYLLANFTYFEGGDDRALDARMEQEREALRLIDVVLDTAPRDEHPWAYTLRGIIERRAGDFDAAIGSFEAALQIDPQFASALNSRCFALAKNNRAGEGIGDCRKAARLNPSSWQTLHSLAYAYARDAQIDSATTALACAQGLVRQDETLLPFEQDEIICRYKVEAGGVAAGLSEDAIEHSKSQCDSPAAAAQVLAGQTPDEVAVADQPSLCRALRG